MLAITHLQCRLVWGLLQYRCQQALTVHVQHGQRLWFKEEAAEQNMETKKRAELRMQEGPIA